MGKTSIEWTDASWNPIVGCTEISPGCANCYAAKLAGTRLKNHPAYKGLADRRRGQHRWTGEVRFRSDRLEEPLRWKKPLRIFVCDMSDLFHPAVSDEFIDRVFAVMAIAQKHTFQILTKRPARMREYLSYHSRDVRVSLAVYRISPYVDHNVPGDIVQVIEDKMQKPLPNVWVGTSVENQHFADERIPLLLQTPAAVRWISAEPLLGPVDLRFLQPNREVEIDSLKGTHGVYRPHRGTNAALDWMICGGESGSGARPMHPDWARSLRDQCQAAGVPFFFKQWGAWKTVSSIEDRREADLHPCQTLIDDGGSPWLMMKCGKKKAGRLLDGREWNEFPHVTP